VIDFRVQKMYKNTFAEIGCATDPTGGAYRPPSWTNKGPFCGPWGPVKRPFKKVWLRACISKYTHITVITSS